MRLLARKLIEIGEIWDLKRNSSSTNWDNIETDLSAKSENPNDDRITVGVRGAKISFGCRVEDRERNETTRVDTQANEVQSESKGD